MSDRPCSCLSRTVALLAIALAAACGGGGGGSAPPPPAPVISSFSPASGEAGSMVIIAGSNFDGAQAVTFGGALARNFRVNESASISALVPEGAPTGQLTLTTPNGSALSPAAFTVLPSVPTIRDFNPKQGPEGTNVIVKGTHFPPDSTVAFNGLPATTIRMSATELQAVVPTSAMNGPITVSTSTGPATPIPTGFTVTPGRGTLDLFVDGFYITQSAQNYDGTVPLVANRKGLLRVFVRANKFNTESPTVQMTLNETTVVPLTRPVTGVPTSINEGDLSASWDFEMPAGNFTINPTVVKIDVTPLAGAAEADDTNNSVTKSFTLNTAKPFNMTIIPVVQSSLTGNATPANLAQWTERFQRMYPVSGLNVQLAPVPYTTTANLETGGSPTESGSGWAQLLEELELKRRADGSAGYYYGAVNVGYTGGIAGLGYVGLPTAVGWDKPSGYEDGGNFPEIFAHEVAHNLGRGHSPCNVSNTDPLYPFYPPYPDGSIGQWGWDPDAPAPASSLRSPETNEDIMSYCSPLWVSEYTYRGVMDFRAASSLGAVAGAAQQDCLLVSGRIRDGQVTLGSAFRVTTVPHFPAPGAYTLQLQDGQGAALQEIAFAPVEVADLPAGSEQHFAFAIPMGAGVEPALAGLRVLERGAVRASKVASGLAAGLGAGVRPAVSVRMRPGQAHLSWDPIAHPRVMVRDVRTGEVLSFAEGGSLDLATDAQELDVTFSDGVRSTRQILTVQ